MKKFKTINQGDLLTFQADDGKYKVLLCTSTYKDSSPHYFTFAALAYDSIDKPTLEHILNSEFFGIGNRKTYASIITYKDNELEKMWAVHPEVKPYHLGSYGMTIRRKQFMTFQDNFEMIGNIDIVNHLDKNGNSSVNADSWNFLKDFFNKKFKVVLPERGQKLFKIKAILKN